MNLAIEIAKALAPLLGQLAGAFARLVGGATDEETITILRQLAEETAVTDTRIDEVRNRFAARDAVNDARGLT